MNLSGRAESKSDSIYIRKERKAIRAKRARAKKGPGFVPPPKGRPCLLPGGGETTRTSVEVSHEHLADPPGGIPGAGGVVGKAEIPGGAARLRNSYMVGLLLSI